jgi:hypothetical protein
MSNRDELRQAVADAIRSAPISTNAFAEADAAMAAYEAHRPRADVVLTREEWDEAKARAVAAWFLRTHRAGYSWSDVMDSAIRAAFPWIKVEGE